MELNWVDFYMEFADKLLAFKANRKSLIEKLQKVCDNAGVNFPKLESDGVPVDIDPFTVFGIFNKGLTNQNRINILREISKEFKVSSEIPDDFGGIPVMSNQKSNFFEFKPHRGERDIDNLWDFFEAAIKFADTSNSTNRKKFTELFDTVIEQRQIKWNITMGLFWIRPHTYLSLDSVNREYINHLGISELGSSMINAEEYLEDRDRILEYIDNSAGCENIVDFSLNAWDWSQGNGEESEPSDAITSFAKNTILYGPPGTGKTYNTVRYAVAIIEGETDEIFNEDYDSVLERFNNYKAEGRIEFTTFHQSYGYEEFIEGIKPVLSDNSDIGYEVKPGVFKEFCDKIKNYIPEERKIDYGIGENPTVWKVSLFGSGDNPIRTDCMKNGRIRVGFDKHGETISEETDFSEEGGKKILEYFIDEMEIGDIVVSCYDAYHFDAVGVITGDYEWHNEFSACKRVRSVKWLVKGVYEDIKPINNGIKFTLATVYKLNASVADILKIVGDSDGQDNDYADDGGNFVYIIDEINRGNISKIFGELITLIEEKKRLGGEEECTVLLPYSKEKFGVPNNLYILGTMNTADRSIAAIDTALRRRFDFIEMPPNPDELGDLEIEGISIPSMLEIINRRISVLYDREHTIGHAYFMPLCDDPSFENLTYIFSNKIIPLLQEYFYDDYQKIRLVLGDNQKENEDDQFIVERENSAEDLFGDSEIGDETTYEINPDAFNNPDAYTGIYEN